MPDSTTRSATSAAALAHRSQPASPCPAAPVLLHALCAVALGALALALCILLGLSSSLVVLPQGAAHEGPDEQDAQHAGTSTPHGSVPGSVLGLDGNDTLDTLGLQAQRQAEVFNMPLKAATAAPTYQQATVLEQLCCKSATWTT